MQPSLLKIGELATQAGVPIATVKHYLREGLIAASRKTGRTMCWYDPLLVDRIRAIKELQETHFLPLDVIRKAMTKDDDAPDDLSAAAAIMRVLAKPGGRKRTRAELLKKGVSERELDWLAAAGLAVPSGPDLEYSGDGLALLSTLGAARKAGISAEMLPFQILNEYLAALRALVEVELKMFRAGVLSRAKGGDVERLTTAATELSERLVILLRRQLLLPTLQRLIEEERHARTEPARNARNARRARGVHRKRGVDRRRRG
ncbi:MAG: MerR family transcriptional regulator [Myxococcota bacterium]|nr:MerR family transcriptional regulator [Deltaproteobacteria bacterium]MDQ3338196.1 MerR family transcriptional regulator [Myxococcota bacterium]